MLGSCVVLVGSLMLYLFLVWVIYFLLALIATWPIGGTFGTAVPGSEGDVWVHLWTFRWVRDSLAAGEGFLYTDLLYGPDGVSLATHNFAWFHIALWIPLQALIGEASAYSLIFIFGFSLTAFTTYVFVNDILKNRVAAFLAGLIVGFWPYTLSHHNHPNLIFIGFVPLALFCITRFFRRPAFSTSIMVGLSIGMIAIVRWQLLIYSFPLILIYTIYVAVNTYFSSDDESGLSRDAYIQNVFRYALPALLIGTVLTAASMSPILLNLDSTDFSNSSLNANDTLSGSTDLAAYIVPSRYHRLWGEGTARLTDVFIINANYTPYLGFGASLLALLGLVGRPRKSLIWFAIGIIYMSLALGPRLLIWSEPVWDSMPYDLIEGTLLDAVIRRPDRLNILLSIPVAMLAALGLQVIQDIAQFTPIRPQLVRFFPSTSSIVVPALILIVFVEYINDYPMYQLEVPVWHQQLAQEDGDFAILDLPRHPRAYDEFYMQYQHVHGKQLVGGHVSRPPAAAFQFVDSISFLNVIDRVEPNPQTVSVVQDFERLAAANVRYIVLHKGFMAPIYIERWRKIFLTLPTYEDDQVIVYETEAAVNQALLSDYQLDPPQSISLFDHQMTVPAPTQEGLIEAQAVWLSTEALEADEVEACLLLFAGPQSLIEESCETIQNDQGLWPAYTFRRTTHRIEIPRYISPADYQVALQINPAGSVKDLGRVVINVVPRRFDVPVEIEYPLDLSYGSIDLLGYDLLEQSLTLYWQSLERTERYFIRFVHIVDSQTGLLVAQVDTAPRDYGYPTTWWEEGEVIVERVALPLASLPEGEYEVYLGLYDRDTGERAPLAGDISSTEGENRAVLLDRLQLNRP